MSTENTPTVAETAENSAAPSQEATAQVAPPDHLQKQIKGMEAKLRRLESELSEKQSALESYTFRDSRKALLKETLGDRQVANYDRLKAYAYNNKLSDDEFKSLVNDFAITRDEPTVPVQPAPAPVEKPKPAAFEFGVRPEKPAPESKPMGGFLEVDLAKLAAKKNEIMQKRNLR